MRAIAVVVLSVVAYVSVLIGQSPPQDPPRFTTSVDLVHLDVSVLDRDRRPVRGLTPADFTILEDGKPQRISVFQAVDIPIDPPSRTDWVRSIAPDVRSNTGAEDGRLFLIIMDDAVMQSSPRGVQHGREIARAFVSRLRSSDRAAVIFTRDNRNAQDYTADKTLLLRAVDRFSIGFRDMVPEGVASVTESAYYMFSVDTLLNAVSALSSIPDRRKSIVYVGQGLPFDPAAMGPAAIGLTEDGSASAASKNATGSAIANRVREIFRRAKLANVNVYALDVCGLRSPPPAGGAPFPVATCVPGLEMEYLQMLAGGTGGRAFINANDLTPAVDAIYEENSSYYLLGFTPGRTQDGKTRRLEVRVNRPGVTVRTRAGYQSEKPSDIEKRRNALAESPLGVALSGIVPKSDLPLEVSAVPFHVDGRKQAMVAIAVGVQQPIRITGPRTVERVALQVSAFDVNGKAHGTSTMRADVTIREGATGLVDYEVLSKIELKPGRYQLRLAAHVNSLSISGSVYHDVEVPDFRAAPLTMSGILLGADPGPVTAPRDALAKLVPIVPTVRRTFDGTEKVAAFTRIYQGGKGALVEVPIRVRLTDDAGIVLMEKQERMGPERFPAGRAGNVLVDVPVARLAPGEYLLTIEATGARTSPRKDIRFRVRPDLQSGHLR